ncbi:MAG: hypothetical protein JNM94_07660 [Phycisphaerae bacterium]|nr:hypothetical protein [Phycisphaerae bacterium]
MGSKIHVLASVAVSGLAAVSHADIVKSVYLNAQTYHYKVYHMPDFDQKRQVASGVPGLPGSGAMYCVPTSTYNLFCYAANHGFPFFEDANVNWQSPSLYNYVTGRLIDLGGAMSCDAQDGTNGAGWVNGIDSWIEDYNAGLLCHTHYWNTSDYTVRADRVAKKAASGSIVAFAYGRYSIIGDFGGFPLLMRTGGHAVTLTEAFRVGSLAYLRYRDPADDVYNSTQSTFVSKEVSSTDFTFATAPFPGALRTVTAIDYPSSDGNVRLIDEFACIRPIYFMSFLNTGGGTPTWKLKSVIAGTFGAAPAEITLASPAFGIADLAIDADGDDAVVLVNVAAATGATQLRRVDTVTGESTPLGGFNTLKRFAVGRTGRIYAHDGDKIYCILPDGALDAAVSNVNAPTAMAYDDENDDVLILSVAQRRITRLDKTLAQISTFTVPPGVPMSGDGSVIVNPFDGAVYFLTDGSNTIFRLLGTGANPVLTSFTVPGVTSPKGIGAGDRGELYVTVGGLAKCLRKNRAGAWEIDTTSPFHNVAAAPRFSPLRSRTNFDPAIHNGPEWKNIPVDELLPIGVPVADCVGDLDGDSDTDGADIARLLGNWGSSDLNSDITGDGIVDGADLAALLGSWGPCE